MAIVDNITGEVVEENEKNTVNYQLAVREVADLAVLDEWLDLKEAADTAKEKLDMVEKPLRKKLTEIFEKYAIHRIDNPYVDILLKNGYAKESWDEEKLIAFIYRNGGDPKDFKLSKWVNGGIQLKYKR